MATYAEQLASVQAAIARIEATGQEIDFEGKRRREADLDVLYKRERNLRAMVDREARGGGIRTRRVVPYR